MTDAPGGPAETLSAAAAGAARRAADEAGSNDLAGELLAVAGRVGGPLHLAVGGKLKAGKSTLVNALIGRRVAATAVSECTKVVAWYRHGDRDRIEVHGRDGGSWTIPPGPDGLLPSELGAPTDEIDHVTVTVTSRSRLGRLTLIDTPGLDSLNDEFSAGTRRAMGLDEGSRRGMTQADALLYLMPHPGDRDVQFLTDFQSLYGDSRLCGANAVGVLSRIDQLSPRPGLRDPWPDARKVAARYTRELRRFVRVVIPVVGLLAQTALGGSFTERDAATIVGLARLPDRSALLSSVLTFRNEAHRRGVDGDRLLSMLDLYGLSVCFELVDEGAHTAKTLLRGLRAASGVDPLLELVDSDFSARADALRAARALAELERLSYRDGAGPRAAAALRADIEAIRLRPDYHVIAELGVLRRVAVKELVLPPERERDLMRLLTLSDVAARLGLPPEAAPDELRGQAAQLWTAWREQENEFRATTAQRAAAAVVRHSLEQMLGALSAAQGPSGPESAVQETEIGSRQLIHASERRPS